MHGAIQLQTWLNAAVKVVAINEMPLDFFLSQTQNYLAWATKDTHKVIGFCLLTVIERRKRG
jgi:hypothetical protein